ncbi:unnamed protein product [Hyaloperonospora brassicae]|uniref:B box-type domain-containing protein n=1 Tax=Hyaloperonospora brassicae TaxID=162125 RepID=A0AAV0SXU4_HYABA|nr:unnamed protein product [Hyaloperonospora brassicae]
MVHPGSSRERVWVESEKREKGTQGKALCDPSKTAPTAAAAFESNTSSSTGNEHTAGREAADSPSAGCAFEQKVEGKLWYDVLPTVLQKFKKHDREQIKQLMLPRCALCERVKVNQKAVIECHQKECSLLNRPLCLVCWKSTHLSRDDAHKKHHSRPTSLCPQCQLDQVEYWCAECDLKFCRACFKQIHSVHSAKDHRKIATEDAPGTCLAQSHWSTSFYETIRHLIASRKLMVAENTGGSTSSIGGKRKREIEVIVIDNDDDDEQYEPGIIPSSSNQSPEQQMGASGPTAVRQTSRSNDMYVLPQRNTSADTADHTPAAYGTVIEPFPFFEEPIQATSVLPTPYVSRANPSYSTSSSKGVNNVTSHASSGVQWSDSNFSFGLSPLARNGNRSSVYATNVMADRDTLSPAPASADPPIWPPTHSISPGMASALNSSTVQPSGGAVFAENVLVDSLVDRYHEVNQNVASMELQSEQLTRQIALAACQGPYSARPMMDLLNKLQPALEAAKGLRDKLLIAMIIQSDDIMAAVRPLRLSELGDVPQVPSISHRKCLQFSIEISRHKKKLVELNQRISDTLTKSYAVTSSTENSLIQSASAEIQMHERNIARLKKARNVEFVRIVQFSSNIREALKHTFQRTFEAQRQQQQLQQFQPL